MQRLSRLDQWLASTGDALQALAGGSAGGSSPAELAMQDDGKLTALQRRECAALMRVNHVGEICAQALYAAQALTARDPALRHHHLAAAAEEGAHLSWTRERLSELGGRASFLNPLWYAGAFGIGLLAGRSGDRASLGFVAETERQVEQHLSGHLRRLPVQDIRSRTIVERMRDDEIRHGRAAEAAGGTRPPWPVRLAMRAAARLMTATAYYI